MEAAARTLYRSLEKFRAYPDWMQIWPGHGAGSACGKGLSAVPHSTVGYERRFNWAFQVPTEAAFVGQVLDGQPEPPTYFAEMKRINKEGPRVLGSYRRPERLPVSRLAEVLSSGAAVVDMRPAADYAAGHVPGTINIPQNDSFTTWAGWFLPFDRDLYLVAVDGRAERVDEAVRDLAMIGLDRVAGFFGSLALEEWRAAGGTPGTVAQVSADELAARLDAGDVTVLDVRGRAEWEAGHLPGVRNIPVGHLVDHLAELPRDRPLVLHCQGGARSSIGASVLQAHGFTNIVNLAGGFAEWHRGGRAVEREASAPAAAPAVPAQEGAR